MKYIETTLYIIDCFNLNQQWSVTFNIMADENNIVLRIVFD